MTSKLIYNIKIWIQIPDELCRIFWNHQNTCFQFLGDQITSDQVLLPIDRSRSYGIRILSFKLFEIGECIYSQKVYGTVFWFVTNDDQFNYFFSYTMNKRSSNVLELISEARRLELQPTPHIELIDICPNHFQSLEDLFKQ